MFSQSEAVDPANVASVTIGTTHFINAVVEMDRSRLAKVGVIRLCGPFSEQIPVGIDWPPRLRDIICGHRSRVQGGLEIDGSLIAELDEDEVRREAEAIKAKGIKSIAIVGVFSPIDVVHRQEIRAAEIVKSVFPEADIVCSKDVANIGFFERENAAVLNASILSFARKTINSFQTAVQALNLHCPLFITQNDGTIIPASAAARLPIRTFSSGPTNSMRGAAFLMQNEGIKEAMMVVDIGGTTTDVGLLQKNGFPRQAAAYSEIAGVRTNFSYPDVRSIGLGGGSIVSKDASGNLTVGPESVGYQIRQKALVFGGDIPTTTDYTVLGDSSVDIGDRTKVDQSEVLKATLPQFKSQVKSMLETIVDTMKTSPEPIPVVLVGGGAVIAPDTLHGASRVVKPNWSGVANAIGAATARVSGVIDSVESTESRSKDEVVESVTKRAIEAAVASGAKRETVTIAELESFPLQYIADKSRFLVKAVGDFDYSRTDIEALPISASTEDEEFANDADHVASKVDGNIADKSADSTAISASLSHTPDSINGYKPNVIQRTWYLSETDLEFISTGCYILGTGGGGSPYQHFLRLRKMVREGVTVRVVSPHDLKDDAIVACGGAKGSPQVSTEKPVGDEILESQRELYAYLKKTPDAVIPLEIGGGNGLQGLIIGASNALNIPAIDGDWMGRAYPVSWQITPVVYEKKAMMVPSCMSDGNGRIMFMTKAPTELDVERAMRAALSQMGSHVGCAKGPVSGANTKKWVVENTMSLAWRIGRAVALARCTNTIDNVAESIIEQVGGSQSAKVLFKGKIVGVERVLRMGHAYGEVKIESTSDDGSEASKEKLVIPFKNENIYAKKVYPDGVEEVVAMVPDLITVLDAQNGEALGTQDYRYGLPVVVIGITASEKWTSTDRGLEIGGPKGFGFNDLEYKALGTFSKPVSVIDEYDQA